MADILIPRAHQAAPMLSAPVAVEQFVVRLRRRTGLERMSPTQPEPAVLEIGWGTRTDPSEWRKPSRREFGRMVGVNLSGPDQIIGAMHGAADLWARELARRPELRGGLQLTDSVVVRFRIGRGAGNVKLELGKIADSVHQLAERWARERADAAGAFAAMARGRP